MKAPRVMAGRCPPDLVLMAGLPGVGKSAIAVEVAEVLGYSLFDIDDIRGEVDALSDVEDWELRGRLAYNILKALVARQIQLGVSVVVDTPLTHQWLRSFMFTLADRQHAIVHVVYCHCSDEVAIERNKARFAQDPGRYADRNADNFHRIKRLFQPIDPIVSLYVDTENSVASNVATILDYIEIAPTDKEAQPEDL